MNDEPVATITVVCDNEQHARKTVTVTVLTFYADGEFSRDTHRRRRQDRLTQAASSGRDVRLARIRTLFGNDPVLCRLCGRRLPSDAQLGAVADRLVASGASTLTLTQIAAIVSM